MREQGPVTLQNLYGGAALEAVNYELANVFANIQDPNTEATLQREVTLKIKVKPNQERGVAEIRFQVFPELAPTKEFATAVLLDRVHGECVGFEIQQGAGEPCSSRGNFIRRL